MARDRAWLWMRILRSSGSLRTPGMLARSVASTAICCASWRRILVMGNRASCSLKALDASQCVFVVGASKGGRLNGGGAGERLFDALEIDRRELLRAERGEKGG